MTPAQSLPAGMVAEVDRGHQTEVNFRGGKREVDFEHEGGGVIVWNFVGEDVCSGVDTTKAEQDDVYQQLWAYLEDWWAPRPEDDL